MTGHKAAVERAVELAKGKGAKRAVMLPVSAPFHCALMQPAADVMADALAKVEIATPRDFFDYQAKYLADTTQYSCHDASPAMLAGELQNVAVAAAAGGADPIRRGVARPRHSRDRDHRRRP